MDSLITAAGRALRGGDPLGALKMVALREDPPALALRGIAMAQLGDLARAKALLLRAARGFGSHEAVARARCRIAVAEVALASRDLDWDAKALEAARTTLETRGDHVNAAHARYLEVRHLVLIGRLDEAEEKLRSLDPAPLPHALAAAHELSAASIAMRRLRTKEARAALSRAARAARQAAIPALLAEVDAARRALEAPAARLIAEGGAVRRPLSLGEVASLLASKALVVDACHYVVRDDTRQVALAKRPVLFALVRALAEAWPADVRRDALVARALQLKLRDESHRARLRVEIARLRTALAPFGAVTATAAGFKLAARRSRDVVVLAPPMEEEGDRDHGATPAVILAMLADGESWSTSALSLALGIGQRTIQRALDALAAAGKVQSVGQGRARRWMTPPLTGFATTLLLPVPWLAQ